MIDLEVFVCKFEDKFIKPVELNLIQNRRT